MAKVLVVDDSQTVRNEVCDFLETEGITVVTACDGLDGIAKIKDNSDLNLVLCDINMPNMDGLTMVEQVRQIMGDNSLNIIMLTTERSRDMVDRGKDAGVKGWIVKPFNGPAAIGGIKKLIGIG